MADTQFDGYENFRTTRITVQFILNFDNFAFSKAICIVSSAHSSINVSAASAQFIPRLVMVIGLSGVQFILVIALSGVQFGLKSYV